VANGRKAKKNTIFSLESEDNVIKGDDELLKHATEYYKNLGPEINNFIPLDPEMWGQEENSMKKIMRYYASHLL
jgi:hypothetical protein